MRLLIVEDRKDKQNNIKDVIMNRFRGQIEIDVESCYFSARDKIIETSNYFMLIIDMFLPDAKDDDEPRGLAGKDLIFDMKLENIIIPTLVVTQYTEYTNSSSHMSRDFFDNTGFLENSSYGKELLNQPRTPFDCTNFFGLHEYLSAEVPFYLGILYYSNQFKKWENNLLHIVDKIVEEANHENTTT